MGRGRQAAGDPGEADRRDRRPRRADRGWSVTTGDPAPSAAWRSFRARTTSTSTTRAGTGWPPRASPSTARPTWSRRTDRRPCSTPAVAPGGSPSSSPAGASPWSASTPTPTCSSGRGGGPRATWVVADLAELDLGRVVRRRGDGRQRPAVRRAVTAGRRRRGDAPATSDPAVASCPAPGIRTAGPPSPTTTAGARQPGSRSTSGTPDGIASRGCRVATTWCRCPGARRRSAGLDTWPIGDRRRAPETALTPPR